MGVLLKLFTKVFIMNDDIMLELTKSVARMEAKMENVVDTIKTMETEVKELKVMAAQAQGLSHAVKAIWVLLGLILGAGGTEAVQGLLNSVPN